MESVSIVPASLAARIPLPDEALTARMLAKAREGFDRKIVVLDDDPACRLSTTCRSIRIGAVRRWKAAWRRRAPCSSY